MSIYESYIDKRFSPATLEVIDAAGQIIQEYLDDGFNLTLRQLYYQFVARDLISNSERSYKRIGGFDDSVLTGLDDLVRDQVMAMKTTFTPGHYRRRVANVLARRLVRSLFEG